MVSEATRYGLRQLTVCELQLKGMISGGKDQDIIGVDLDDLSDESQDRASEH